MNRLEIAFFAAALSVASLNTACGGDDGAADDKSPGGNGSTVDAATWTQYCADSAAHENMCTPDLTPDATPDACNASQRCFSAIIREAGQAQLLECLSARSCDTPDENCYAQVAATLPVSQAQQGYKVECTAKQMECGFDSEVCTGTASLLSDAAYEALQPCFKLSCDATEACLESTSNKLLEPCGGKLDI